METIGCNEQTRSASAVKTLAARMLLSCCVEELLFAAELLFVAELLFSTEFLFVAELLSDAELLFAAELLCIV